MENSVNLKNAEGARHSTAIHEAGHAVTAYAVGRRLMFAVLIDERQGEVMPQCSTCDLCFDYYQRNNPAEDKHSLRIQDELRRDSAVAMAGEIAEFQICGDRYIDLEEVKSDRFKTRQRASMIHLWLGGECFHSGRWAASESCEACNAYLELLKHAIDRLVALPQIRNCIEGLARALEDSEKGKRICEREIESILQRHELRPGFFFESLPSAPGLLGPR